MLQRWDAVYYKICKKVFCETDETTWKYDCKSLLFNGLRVSSAGETRLKQSETTKQYWRQLTKYGKDDRAESSSHFDAAVDV